MLARLGSKRPAVLSQRRRGERRGSLIHGHNSCLLSSPKRRRRKKLSCQRMSKDNNLSPSTPGQGGKQGTYFPSLSLSRHGSNEEGGKKKEARKRGDDGIFVYLNGSFQITSTQKKRRRQRRKKKGQTLKNALRGQQDRYESTQTRQRGRRRSGRITTFARWCTCMHRAPA